jgi:DNA-binding CsgD family transcriptional regulator
MTQSRATNSEIARALGCSVPTLKRYYAAEIAGRPPGPVPPAWNEADRSTVRMMAAYGIPQDEIAKYLGIAPQRLRADFRDELDRGATAANTQIAATLFEMATRDRNVTAAIFWAKCRMGWRDRDPVIAQDARSPVPLVAEGSVPIGELMDKFRKMSPAGRAALDVALAELEEIQKGNYPRESVSPPQGARGATAYALSSCSG